jgi:hypothetical protein
MEAGNCQMKCTQSIMQATGKTVLPEAIQPREALIDADGNVFNVTEASTKESSGQDSRGLPGSESVACIKRRARNLGDPFISRPQGWVGLPNRKEGWPMDKRESDLPIVLGAWESRAHGEGANKHSQLSKETSAGRVRPEPLMQTSLRGIAY